MSEERDIRKKATTYFARPKEPLSRHPLEDARQTERIWLASADSGKGYGCRKLADVKKIWLGW